MTPRPRTETRVLLEDLITSDRTAERDDTPGERADAGPAAAPATSVADSLVGEVLDARHPVLQGRVQVRWQAAGADVQTAWLPCLQGITVRRRDRVLLQQAANWPDLLVVGVVDGFAQRPRGETVEAARLQLLADETLTVTAADEQPLLEIQQSETGTRIRLLREDIDIELPGRLQLSARQLDLQATGGSVTIAASDDVKVSGEVIRLN